MLNMSDILKQRPPERDVVRLIIDTNEWELNGIRWRGCIGHPHGSCRAPKEEGPYCRKCYAAYQGDCLSGARKEKTEQLIEEGIADGYLPVLFRNFTRYALYPNQAALLNEIEVNANCNAWITGKPGTGKTYLCQIVARSYLQRCRKVAWATSQTLYEARSNPRTQAGLVSADLLVLDDIDKGNLGSVAIGHIHRVLNARHESRSRTLVTSEFVGAVVKEKFKAASGGEYTTSTLARLDFPKHPCMALELVGANLRRAI